MMVVGRRITKGEKQTKWEVKQQETHETITQIKQEVTITDIRETEKEGKHDRRLFSFLYFVPPHLLCPPNCDPGIILCTPQWRREEPCWRSFNLPHAHTGVFFEEVFLCMMHERAGAPRKYTNLTRRRNISLHSEVILTSLLPLLVGGIRWG